MARPESAGAGSDKQDAGAQHQPDPRRWRALTVCLVGGFMVLLDVSIVNVALPSIRTGLHAPQSDLQWVLSGYALTFGLLLVPAGRLGDVYGRRSMFTTALALFTLASIGCGVAQDSTWLVVARLLQGFAGGILTPQISALIQQMFSGRERGTAFGIFGSVVGISTAIGPLLGGALIAAFGQQDGWRWVFFVNVPIGVVAIPLAYRLLPAPAAADSRERKHRDLDPLGVGLLGVAVVTLLLPLVQEQQWHAAAKWLLIPAALAIAGVFVWWERRYQAAGREPVVDLGLFRHRSYSFGVSTITLYFAGFTPLFFVFTLYVQIGLHYSALMAGLATTPFAIGSAIAATLGGRAVHRTGRALVAAGLVIVAVGLGASVLAVYLVPRHGTGWATLLPLLIAGLGSGLVIAPNQTLTLAQVPVERAGTAGGLLQTGQRIGTAVGIAAVGSVFFSNVSSSHGDFAVAYRAGVLVAIGFVGAALLAALADVIGGNRSAATAYEPQHAAQQR